MINAFNIGDQKTFLTKVDKEDLASFNGEQVHPFYGTYALTRDAEWSSRLFVLEMKEDDEEGIGTFVNLEHKAPALLGEEVTFVATVTSLIKNAIECGIEVKVGDRLIAVGSTGQKIIKRTKLEELANRFG